MPHTPRNPPRERVPPVARLANPTTNAAYRASATEALDQLWGNERG